MAMARAPAYWTNKKCRSSVQTISQLSLSQVPRGLGSRYGVFGARYHGFLSAFELLKNRQARQANTCQLIAWKCIRQMNLNGHDALGWNYVLR